VISGLPAQPADAQLWMNLQNRYDVEIAKRDICKKLDKMKPIIAQAAA